jgi:hypothetical protein
MANFDQNQAKNQLDEPTCSDLQKIDNLLKLSEDGKSTADIDKQILAAAYREVSKPKRSNQYQFSFWRKLSLPLYICSGFVLTVLAYNTLLIPGEQVTTQQESASRLLKIESGVTADDGQKNVSQRQKHVLPELKIPEQAPQRVVTESNSTAIEIGTSGEQYELIEQGIYTGSQLKKAAHPEKEAWAREIIILLTSGETEKAHSELNQFKKIYPDYPIEEQVKGLIR